MAKDLARLQEEAAVGEKERIGRLKVEEKLKQETLEREKIASTMIPKEVGTKEKKVVVESLLPKAAPASTLEKVLIRVMVVFLLLAFFVLITFGYWLLAVKGKSQPTISPVVTPSSPATPTSTPSLTPTPVIPASIVPVKETKILRIGPGQDLPKLLEETIRTTLSESKSPEFFQLAVEKNDLFLGIGEFFGELNLTAPADFLKAVPGRAEDSTFFLYAKKGEQRLGLVIKLQDQSAADSAVKAWESSMEKDLESLFLPQGKKANTTSGSFKGAAYQGIPFRYLSFAEKNLGICWTIYNNYLVLTSSGEGLMRTIDLLKKL